MEQLINFIIRPPRAEYNPKNDLLDQEFVLKGKLYQRKDLEVINSRGDTLQCSHYVPIAFPEGKPLPCVIYCHGNSGCRTDASEAAIILLPSNITVFTLDFSGSGLSGGEHVTLGWNEKDDLNAVVNYLRSDGNVSLIGLWGRSMGAVTSLMYGAEDPSIAGMVLDSPFSDLVDLMMELVDTYKVRLPKFTVKFAIQYMRRAIQKKAKFDIMDLNAIKVAKSCFVPSLFGHATDDDFIQPHHSDRIFDAYAGDKNIIKFEGDHNSPRPQFYFDSISIFFNNVLRLPEDEFGKAYFDLTNDYFGNGSWSNFHNMDFSDQLPSSVQAAGSTADAIRQLRSRRRPMSMIVVPSDISTKDKPIDGQVESRGSDSHASSSNMISFELSGASPNGSHLPLSIDDEYVEYSLDTLADFPSNAEEEERMLMEAMIESLKDLDAGHPQVKEPTPNHGSDVEPKPATQNSQEDSLPAQCNLDAPSNSTSMDNDVPNLQPQTQLLNPNDVSKCRPSTGTPEGTAVESHSSTKHDHSKAPLTAAADDNMGTVAATTPCPTSKDAGAHSGTPARNPSEADIADGTKVTMKVERTPSSNIMDGLLRRWDRNFFRSG